MAAEISVSPGNEDHILGARTGALICGLLYAADTYLYKHVYTYLACCDGICFAFRFPMQARPPMEDAERSNHDSFTLAQELLSSCIHSYYL